MIGEAFNELPMNKLWSLAQSRSYRVAICIETGTETSWLDTLDVWDGRPGKIGSRLMGRASLVESNVDDAAIQLVEELA